MTDSSDSSRFLSRRPGRSAIAAVVLLFTGFVAGFVAAFLVWLFLGGGVWRSEVRVAEAELRSPDTLALVVDSCNGNPEVSLLQETDIDVQVKVVASSTPLLGGQDCQDVIEVQLQEPLGDRVVVDKHTRQSVNVNIIN